MVTTGARLRMAPCVVGAALLCLVADAAPDCKDYVRRGYCHDDKFAKYMARHCPDTCGGSAAGGQAAEVQEDEACANWAAEGYCTHPQFVEYMKRSCPRACGFPVPATNAAAAASADADEAAHGAGDAAAGADEMEVEEEEEADEEDAAAPAAPKWSSGAAAGAAAGGGAAAADEAEHCAGWARQGLCDAGSTHYEYMKQNCAATCARTPEGGGADAGGYGAADPMTCARWAMMGYCAEGHAHATFMRSSCADACEKAAQMGEKKAPPFDIWVLLLLGGFGYAVVYAVKHAVQRDGMLSEQVSRHTLGRTKGIGEGAKKANRGAKGEKVRSAKKAN